MEVGAGSGSSSLFFFAVGNDLETDICGCAVVEGGAGMAGIGLALSGVEGLRVEREPC